MRDYKFTLSAGIPQKQTIDGNGYHVMLATSAISLQLDNGIKRTRYQGTGEYAIPNPFKEVTLTSATTQSVTIAIGKGRISDARATLSGTVTATVSVSDVIEASPLVVVGAGATVLLSGADTTRKALRIGVDSNQANGVYFGDINTGISNAGAFIDIGSADYIETTSAVYAYNAGADSISVNIVELKKV